ncbi:MAG: ATP synthase F1 subunit epsilon [Marinilabiliales bacterium]|nr:MAG: ATP synthase F1 subunit epsilon [Marinilabiliales bacterium]
MYLEILTPDKTAFSGRVKSVTVPGSKGPFTILINHAPIISTLETGEINLQTEQGDNIFFMVNGGMIEVNNNKIMVLSEKVSIAEL